MAQLERHDAARRLADVKKTPVGKQLDHGVLRIGEADERRGPGNRIRAFLATQAVFGEPAPDVTGIHLRPHLEGKARAALMRALFQHDRKLSDRTREKCAVAFTASELQTHDALIIVDLAFEIGRFERGVANALGFDHGLPLVFCVFVSRRSGRLQKRGPAGARQPSAGALLGYFGTSRYNWIIIAVADDEIGDPSMRE
jgi:hypothetical protein